jgi:hypothetical protein
LKIHLKLKENAFYYGMIKIGGVFFVKQEESSLYDKLPLELLAGFFYTINQNIKTGNLSNAMYQEIKLIEETALKRGISLEYLYDKGSRIIQTEKLKKTSCLS